MLLEILKELIKVQCGSSVERQESTTCSKFLLRFKDIFGVICF